MFARFFVERKAEVMNTIMFQNREEAARLLAHELLAYKGKNPLVLGIPRGAVPMAAIIAGELEGELDVVLVHKLGAPGQPELAIGAVNEMGDLYLGDYVEELDIDADVIERNRSTISIPKHTSNAP